MATRRMLVDAIHPEETRIVVTSGNRLEEFDFESADRRQLRGNIYLAKVTRVEPSLQAAFVEYGGNRHGFLAFSEIHPDYYQIPVADREALMQAEEEEAEDEPENAAAEAGADETASDDAEHDDEDSNGDAVKSDRRVEQIGSGDALEDLTERPRRQIRRYKIQEVIKRRQILLVQVVKEERGNKGAALTTYLSLAGRYSVLMPNTARGGGISRKITSAADRKRLKEIASDLEVPKGMGVILRTAGASRTKSEVKRDFEYLMRLWENVRTLTLQSSAPCLVYEEGSLIKRTIRDLYNKDINEVLVAGDAAYREAKDFMRMIMPSHSKNVQAYKDDAPIFSRYSIEPQLDSMFHPQVTLPSGGYIVINPTEALVSIDVNSGRATKEHNIEDTALQTNLEASEEISRQLRLRDLAGLIVIDFIDMEEKRNNRAVERKLKDCLKNDRARIQVGHISHFGLMEMSRQRMRFGVLESSTHSCPTCAGTGLVRSVSSLALMIMRAVEDHVMRKPGNSINVRMPTEVALYILNSKRNTLTLLEHKYSLSITITADGAMMGNQFAIERGEARAPELTEAPAHVRADAATLADYDDVEDEAEDAIAEDAEEEPVQAEAEPDSGRGKRRRRRRRGAAADESEAVAARRAEPEDAAVEEEAEDDETGQDRAAAPGDDDDQPRKRRRRGRRGGRRNRRGQDDLQQGDDIQQGDEAETADPVMADAAETEAATEAEAVAELEKLDGADAAAQDVAAEAPAPAEAVEPEPAPEAEAKPKRTRRARKPAAKAADAVDAVSEPVEEAAAQDAAAEPAAAEPAEKPAKPARAPRKPRATKAKTTEAKTTGAKSTETKSTKAAKGAGADKAVAQAAEMAEAVAEAAEPAAPASSEAPEPATPAGADPAPSHEPSRRPDEVTVAAPEAEPEPKPKKVGWWQRGFFS